jgi:hypothetical protein
MFLEVDVKDDLGIMFDISDETKLQIGDAIVNQIRQRTQAGKPLGSARKFVKYSDAYAAKKGVGVNDVDLTLTEDMLEAMFVEDIVGDNIVIGFADSDVIPRAFNHHTGDTLPKRPFFGIQKNELSRIKSEFKTTIDREKRQSAALEGAIDATVESILEGLNSFG